MSINCLGTWISSSPALISFLFLKNKGERSIKEIATPMEGSRFINEKRMFETKSLTKWVTPSKFSGKMWFMVAIKQKVITEAL